MSRDIRNFFVAVVVLAAVFLTLLFASKAHAQTINPAKPVAGGAGPTGPQGPTGPAGPATTVYAQIDAGLVLAESEIVKQLDAGLVNAQSVVAGQVDAGTVLTQLIVTSDIQYPVTDGGAAHLNFVNLAGLFSSTSSSNTKPFATGTASAQTGALVCYMEYSGSGAVSISFKVRDLTLGVDVCTTGTVACANSFGTMVDAGCSLTPGDVIVLEEATGNICNGPTVGCALNVTQ